MTVEHQRDVDGLQAAGWVVSAVREAMLAALEPGMTTAELDALGDELLRGARSAPRLTYAFPGATCISINEEAAHGVPGDRRVLREGMVIAVEPFLSTRATAAREAADGWTLCTTPGNFSAQYEHTLIVIRGRPIVVTAPHT